MKCCDIIRSLCCCVALCCALAGCVEQKPLALDKDDLRIAAFYGDYLLLSGVPPDVGAGQDIALLDSTDISALLVRHELTQEALNRKIEVYKRNPYLWRSVLQQVRLVIRKKTVPVK
ncbi:MAG: hypothetical protein FDX02_04055 [Chlorobium sp.]|nr:MAG: hypothetical protein FDX02_04055 [Chlorobium sp.]